MRQQSRTRKYLLIALLLLILLGGLLYANYTFSKNNPGGNDFLVHWVGTRSFLIDGLSPYSDAVALRIQTLVYGRAAQPGEHELRVAYPLYSILLFMPFSLIADYTWARAAWMTLLEVGLIMLLLMSLKTVGWRPKPWLMALLLAFTLLWYHAMRPLVLGNVIILQALCIVTAFSAIKDGEDGRAGLLLAFATIKPQVVVVPFIFIFIWAIYQKRWRILGWFMATMVLLAAFATLMLPSWWLENLREVLRYPAYNPPGSLSAVFAVWWPAQGGRIGMIVSGLIGLVLLFEWWTNRRSEFNEALWTLSITLVLGQWVGIQNDPGNFILLFFPIIYVFSIWIDRWKHNGQVLVLISMTILMFGIWVLFIATVENSYQPIQNPLMFIPLPLFLIAMLYWVRWWALRRTRVLAGETFLK